MPTGKATAGKRSSAASKLKTQIPEVAPRSRTEWRRWLEKHHASAGSVWVIFAKKDSGIPTIGYVEAVEEALCFGWIDSLQQKVDTTRNRQLFTERKPRGNWARSNKERVARLIEEGRMTPAGLAKIEAAKKDGSWSRLDAIDLLQVPEDLAAALAKDRVAGRHFEAFPPSAKKMILWWVISAKRPETRARRIEETVRKAALNVRAAQ